MRVIDDEGKQIGVLTKEEALKKAQEEELDLVEIAPNAKPPVARIIDYKKFRYLEERKEKEARKHTKETELKEVRFSPFIGEHDLNTGLEKVKKFILSGDIVKISIQFKGRQMAHTEFGPKLLEKILTSLGEIAEQDREARFEGRRYVTIVKPKKGIVKKHLDQEKENQKKETKENIKENDETKNQESSS